jgi:hypothetical protein
MVLLIEGNLEGQDRKHLIDIATDILDTTFLPCPYLWGYIIVYRYVTVTLYILGDGKIKPRIVYQNKDIGLPR